MKILFNKGISSLYGNITVKNGFIENQGKKIYVFSLTPLNMLTDNPDYLYQIYNAYITCIRNINCNYKIIRLNNISDIKSNIEFYKNRMENVENDGLKKAIFNYLLQLEKLTNEDDYITSKYYVLAELSESTSEFEEYFKPLTVYGFNIRNIQDYHTIKKIISSLLLREDSIL